MNTIEYGLHGLSSLLLWVAGTSAAPAQSFTAGALSVTANNPTSLQFGPDNRLYVSEQYGVVRAFTVVRSETGEYSSTSSEIINLIRDIQNHDDQGGPCSADCARRQVTGVMVAGTGTNPVLYVTSSDPRIAVANDSGLDTNSGIVTRLKCVGGVSAGLCASWNRVDIVRGLPRSEENHSSNGMDLDAATNTLYLASGGNTNQGAPSYSFSGTTEYFMAAAILSIDLNAIAAMESANGGPFIDARNGTRFVYDLLTLDDPTRANITSSDPAFPYASGHPRRNLSIDPGDPFGGNDGFNQAITDPGSPVKIHSPGYRNPFDVLVASNGKLWTWDNGANGGWGGTPVLRDSSGAQKGWINQPGVDYNPVAGDYCTNELNENASLTMSDGLHLIGAAGYYGGHPTPSRAFPALSGIYNYVQQQNGSLLQTGPVYQFGALLPAGYGVSLSNYPNDPRQCAYSPQISALELITSSTNGLTEYTANNFGGAMQGDLLAASFNGNLYRCKPDGNGGLIDLPGSSDGTAIGRCEVLLGGFGSQPLDVTAQASNQIFPGTIWVATYGANNVMVFEPNGAACNPNNPLDDSDGDGYSNGDEQANGTNPCSGGSIPDDADRDFVSDLNDPDDDNDGIPDIDDVFALDAQNGLGTALPLNLPLFNNDPGTGLFGLGFTGLMLPRNGTTTWLQQFNEELLAAGGAVGQLTVEAVTSGDATGSANSQEYAFQLGMRADSASPPFIVKTRIRPPWFAVAGSATTPQSSQSYGMYLGTGDQDNYLRVVLSGDGAGAGVVRVTLEVAGVASSQPYTAAAWGGANILSMPSIDFLLSVNPQTGAVQPRVLLGTDSVSHAHGAPLQIPSAWLSPSDANGLAIGMISTRGAGALSFGATWDYFDVSFTASSGPGQWVKIQDFDQVRHEGAFVQAGDDFHLVGGRESNAVRSYDLVSNTWRAGSASPIQLHHFQAVELNGLIYVIGAMTGACCAESASPNVYIYDPDADLWAVGPALPTGRLRGSSGAVAVAGKLYLISGNTSGHNGPVSPLVDVFDPATGSFTALASIPNARDHFFAVAHQGKIYVAGGRDSNAGADGDIFDDTIAAVDVYDIAGNSWTTLPAASNLPTARAAAATAIVGNELIVAGGESALQSGAHAQTEAMDLTTKTWRSLAPMRTPRHAAQAIVSGTGLYIVAGSSQSGGPTSTPLDLEALYLFGSNPPQGTAIDPSVLQAPTSLDFAQVTTGTTRLLTLTVNNRDGDQATIISALALSGHPDFRVVSPSALPIVIAPGASAQLLLEFAPRAGGTRMATLSIQSPGRLPLQTVLSGTGNASANGVLYRINVGGPEVAAHDGAANWAADSLSAPSALRIAGGTGTFSDSESGAYPGPVNMSHPSLPSHVPSAVFQDERWDPADATEMRWSFPIATGTQVEVRLYFAELFSGINNANERSFDVTAEGLLPASYANIDRFATAGAKGAIMRSTVLTISDGNLDLTFVHGIENPALNAIEIRVEALGAALFANGFE